MAIINGLLRYAHDYCGAMTEQQSVDNLADLLDPCARRVEADLDLWLVEAGTPDTLAEAMHYCVLGGGKRLRPALVYLSAEAVSQVDSNELLRRSAVAVELVHCYSLVHDDLPSMDDDALRRGRPTAHVRFGEAMAILTGDALLTRAMGILAESDQDGSAAVAAELARAAGSAGMIAGQVADMSLCDVEEGLAGLRYIHMHKTAVIIRVAGRIGAICARASERQFGAISDYGEKLGLAFQLIDDMLDVTGEAATLGKNPGRDAANNKRTHVGLLGMAPTAEQGSELTLEAVRALEPLGPKAKNLRRLAELLGERIH